MQLSIQSEDEFVVRIRVAGKITQNQVAMGGDLFRELLGEDAYSRKILLNLRDAEALDSSGVGWLLMTHKRFRENGGRMVLFAAPAIVINVLKVLRIHLVLDLATTDEEARKMIQGETS